MLLSFGFVIAVCYEPISSAHAINYDQKTGMPISLSGDEFIIVRDVALSDSKVQELINGRNYVISDCCAFVQSGEPAAPWQPVINLKVADELQVAVRVDLVSHKVVEIQSAAVIQHKIPLSDGMTKAEQIAAQSSSENGVSTPMFAVNNSTVLPLIGVVGIIFGGAAAGIFYYIAKRNRLAAHAANNK